ncbi:hypothetical protein N0V90_003839 [Kalmusia sp. IMI 367209]|nr:hypothetical protein N0V90_003839 [Kalmusia sp. IMI 367209]
MKFTTAAVIAAFGLLQFASANFDVYRVLDATAVPDENPEPAIDEYMIFEAEPSCDDVENGVNWNESDDVSGDKQGVRVKGDIDPNDPGKIEELEMNFHDSDPIYHWTIYKDRNYDLTGLDGNTYGNCIPFPGDDFQCNFPLPLGVATKSGVRMFRCLTDVTAEQIQSTRG